MSDINPGMETYRVIFYKTTKSIRVEQIGYNLLSDPRPVRWYDSITELPTWMQEKLAVLNMLVAKRGETQTVPGIGRKLSKDIFWVYADE